MSPAATMQTDNSSASLLEALRAAPTAPDAKAAADNLARHIRRNGFSCLENGLIFDTLRSFSINKKSGYERESSAIAYTSLATLLGPALLPLLLQELPIILELLSDKGDVVREAATKALRTLVNLTNIEALESVFAVLAGHVAGTAPGASGKWKAKVGCLKEMARLVEKDWKGREQEAKDEIARLLSRHLPVVEAAMHDTKAEVSSAAVKTCTALFSTLPNPDLRPHIPVLLASLKTPTATQISATIKALSNTTFVSEVTSPSLAVLVPLLQRSLNDRGLGMDTLRRATVVTENVCKLVRDPDVAGRELSPLLNGVEKIMEGASFPEVRAFAASAHKTLIAVGASKTAPPPRAGLDPSTVVPGIKSLLPERLSAPSPFLIETLNFTASLIAPSVSDRLFTPAYKEKWHACLGIYMGLWLVPVPGEEDVKEDGGVKAGEKFGEDVRESFWALDRAKNATVASTTTNGDTQEVLLCDTLFSLAYGALLLLSHTTLRLVRGRRYGICAGNGSGKSTLLRALRDGKVENFPPQSELRAVMVEHSLQGEDASLSIIDFIAADNALADVPRRKIKLQLREVGFDDERQAQTVGSLSGGWKMKLELARAMLYKADLLLLDEPTNHLDRNSVKWLEDYLISHTDITCLIVSHDSGFLDNVTTDIIHYEKKKLVYYPGSLSAFVKQVPSAMSYYTLAATSVKFSFPPPGSLVGVRSNTRSILKLANCTFTYPGRKEPSLIDVSCALSLSSRVGIVGPNGAGKSTLIKLLTGETVPQQGTVYKHPALRVGYVSQHATHHIEHHLEKTPIAYVQWRYQDGHDRELLEKATRVLTEEDKALMDQEFVGRNGEKRKIEMILGRQKLKKTFQYEVKWRSLDHKFNTWIPRDQLLEKGFTKLVQQFDDLESSREGAGQKDTAAHIVRAQLEQVGLDGDIAQYNEMGGLSGGQKVKVVIASALWNNPQVLVLDEPTNFLDREALGGLAVAIRDWGGAVLIISHNEEFVSALCPEIWNVEGGRLAQKGKVAVIEDAFLDSKSKPGSRGTSAATTPAVSAAATPAGSGDEQSQIANVLRPKKKKLTRNQIKAKEERRKASKLHWLTFGGPKPEDTDSD